MIKSLLFVTTICSINVNSFNIKPKEIQWSNNVTQQETFISNNTYNSYQQKYLDDTDYIQPISFINKTTQQYKDNYIEINKTILTQFDTEIYLNNDGTEVNGGVGQLQKTTYIYTEYKAFTSNAILYNYYNNENIFSNFKDNKETIYNYTLNNIDYSGSKTYTNTTDTSNAINQIKNADTYTGIRTAQTAFNTAYNETNKSDWTVTTITGSNKNIYISQEVEGRETQIFYSYTYIGQYATTWNITYNGNLLTTDSQYTEWYNNFYEIIDGQEVWNYNASSTIQNSINNTATISVDTGTSTSPEVIDIAGLMWDIIGMPFTFIMTAFNVTLWPGTPYALNIANLFKGLIALMAILFVIKLFTKGIDVIGNYTGSAQENKYRRENQQMRREQHQMNKEKHEKDMSK